MTARTLSDDGIRRLSVDALNSGLRCYRADLRYSRADALRAAELWNASKASTRATVATVDGFPCVLILDRELQNGTPAGGGLPELLAALSRAYDRGELPAAVEEAWDALQLSAIPARFGGDA